MAKRQLKAGALLAPVPAVLVSVGDENEQNVFTVAWCGTVCTQPPKTYISVRPSRHSYEIIKRTGEFVINLVPSALAKTADFCGVYTGAKVNKFERCGLTPVPCDEVGAPSIAECPVSIVCRVCDVIPLGTHDMFLADILAVYADEVLFDKAGALHLERASLCAYIHGEYFAVGASLGKFGFSAAKKKKRAPKKRDSHTKG